MNSELLIYRNYASKTVDNFYELLCEVQSADARIIDNLFIAKLQDICQISQKLFIKYGPKMPSENGVADSKPLLEVKPSPSGHVNGLDKKRKTVDKDESADESSCVNSGHQSLFEKMMKIISKDVEGSDDSDCEMRAEPLSQVDLFQTDYPEECTKTETEVCVFEKKETHRDISSPRKKTNIPIVDTPFRKVPSTLPSRSCSVDNSGSVIDFDEHIVKINDDVFTCQLCNINNLPKNNVRPHVNGRQHKNALKNATSDLEFCENDVLNVLKDIEDNLVKGKDGLSFIKPASVYKCTLCDSDMTTKESLVQHIYGNKHKRKTEKI